MLWYSKSNRISGFAIMAIMLTVGVIIAVPGRPAGERGFYVYDLGFPLFGYGGLVTFSRSEIIAGPRSLLLRGPLVERSIPWHHITNMRSDGKYLEVEADGHRYTAVAVEAMNFSLIFNRNSSVDNLRIQLDRYRTSYAEVTDDPVVSRPVRPPLYELLLLPVWLVILLLIWR